MRRSRKFEESEKLVVVGCLVAVLAALALGIDPLVVGLPVAAALGMELA